MNRTALLSAINARHDTSFALTGPCLGGIVDGAYGLVDPAGQRAILKYGIGPRWRSQVGRLGPLVAHLLAAGYPTPRFHCWGSLADGTSYSIQEFVAGVPMRALTPEYLDLLLNVNDRQANVRLVTDQNWSAYTSRVVFGGESGWAARLREYSPDTAELLAELEATAAPYAGVALPDGDLVHGDFLPANVLIEGGHVTAVIDIAAAGCGTRAVDLARLYVWCYDDLDGPMRNRLNERMLAVAGHGTLAICVAAQMLDRVAYAIERHAAPNVDHAVRNGRRILAALQSGT